jgi:hypothetical protein
VTPRRRSLGTISSVPSVVAAVSRVLVVAAAGVALVGCASDGLAQPDTPTSTRPEGLDDMRATLADRRADTRDLMETTLLRPDRTGAGSGSSWGSDTVDFLDRAAGATIDVLKMKYLGLW